jgi:hypothetical protein
MTSHIGPDDGPPKSDLTDLLRRGLSDLGEEFVKLKESVSDRAKYPYVAPKPEELQAYIDAAILILPVNPQSPVTYNGVSIAIEDLPTADLRASLGYGHYKPFHRPIIQRTDNKPWPYTPNMCLIATNHKGVWVDPEHLACPGCGLDMT